MSNCSFSRRSSSPRTTAIVITGLVISLVAFTLVARRKGYSGMGGNTIVRCRGGHLFTTIWVPGASIKSVRLGWSRLQYCPVGRHWTLVTPVKDSDLSDEERFDAALHQDIRVP
jgi:hypothetical protein